MSRGALSCRRLPSWIMILAFGRAKRFPAAPPARIMAAADMPMPTQIVDTSQRTCCITSYIAHAGVAEAAGRVDVEVDVFSGSSASR